MNFTPDYLVVARDFQTRDDHARPISSVAQTHFSLLLWVKHLSALSTIRKDGHFRRETLGFIEHELSKNLASGLRAWGSHPKLYGQRANIQIASVQDRIDALLGCCLSLKRFAHGGVVEPRRIELLTPCVQGRCSPS